MSNCDSCGEPIGHAEEIVVEYGPNDLKAFGSSECREIYEEANHDKQPMKRCVCGDYHAKTEMETVSATVHGVKHQKVWIRPGCDAPEGIEIQDGGEEAQR